MSLPRFPDVPDGYTINDSIAQVITSIAMEEIGLSHIINAEGEKLQYILGTLEVTGPDGGSNNRPLPAPPTIEQLLEVNESVKDMLNQVSFSQMFLMGKMQAALGAYQKVTPGPAPITNAFAVAGTGQEFRGGMGVTQVYVPFGPPIIAIGNYVSMNTEYEFTIIADGLYQIGYQLSADGVDAMGNPYPGSVLAVELVKLDSYGNPSQLKIGTVDQTSSALFEDSATVSLNAGDRLRLRVANIGEPNVSIRIFSQAITIIRV